MANSFFKALAFVFLAFSIQVLAENQNFDFTMGEDHLVLISGYTSSCKGINSGYLDTLIEANYLQLNNLNLQWGSRSPLTVQKVRFMIQNADVNGGKTYTCTISGENLLNTWVMDWNVIDPQTGEPVCKDTPQPPTSVTIAAGFSPTNADSCNVVGTTNSCPFSCGGINMTNPQKSSQGVVQVKVFATYRDRKGNLQFIDRTKSLPYSYIGFSQ